MPELGLVGEPRGARTAAIQVALGEGLVPVVGPLGATTRARSSTSTPTTRRLRSPTALGADELVFLSDVPGVLDEQGAVLPQISASRAAGQRERRDAAEARGLRRGAAGRRRAGQHRHRGDGGDAVSLHDRAEAALLPTYPERPLALVRGAGCTVWDEDGDGLPRPRGRRSPCARSDTAIPRRRRRWPQQAAVLGHVSNLFYTEPQVALAERLCALSGHRPRVLLQLGRRGGGGRDQARAPARPGARRRHASTRSCVEDAFHGRTLATLAAGWSAAKREPFDAGARGFEHVPRNDVAALEAAVGPDTCAVLVEPMQGEGGVWPIDAAVLGRRASSATATTRC